ncbi:MAG: molybdenum ABC transporter permease [Anaerolineaceae bacterium]|nr:molybdenum ABC transporter permease [Anaerolineaceae bacterium]
MDKLISFVKIFEVKKTGGKLNIIFIILMVLLLLFILTPLIGTIFSISIKDFISLWVDPEVINSIRRTFWAAFLAVFFCGLVGIPTAYLLARFAFPGRGVLQAFVNIPLVIPHTAAGVALLLVFGRYGIFGKFFQQVGIVFTDRLAGVVVAMAFVGVPFLVNASRQAFASIDIDLESAARVDGASGWQVFRWITLPLAWRGILNGAVMMWARGVSEFGAVAIIAYHPKIVPVLVFERFQGFGLKAALPVTVFLILAAVLVFILLSTVLLPREEN